MNFDTLVQELAYGLWERRGRPHGTDQKDWFDALALANAITNARSSTPPAFFHCFTRSQDPDDAFGTLRLMLNVGILLTPEQLKFRARPYVTQTRLSLAFIPPHEVAHHARAFGHFALRLRCFREVVGKLGAFPVWYVPYATKEDNTPSVSEHGAKLLEWMAKLQRWIHDMRNDPAREAQRHEPHRTTRACLRLLYPTHYEHTMELNKLHFLQREWRIVRWDDSDLDRFAELTDAERNEVLQHNRKFFSADVEVWSDEKNDMAKVRRVDSTYKLKAAFSDVVAEVLVPDSMIAKVKALNPGGPVSSINQHQFGF